MSHTVCDIQFMCDVLSRGQTLEERLKKEYDPFPADIWSCGIVLFVMLSAEAGFLKITFGYSNSRR